METINREQLVQKRARKYDQTAESQQRTTKMAALHLMLIFL